MSVQNTPYVPKLPAALGWLLAGVVVLGYGYLGLGTVLPDLFGDNAAYWLTAQGWSPWQPPSTLAQDFARASTYPPLYPLLLAWAGGAASLQAAHMVTVAMLLAGFIALWWFARRAGLDGLAAAGVTLTFACLHVVRREGLDLHSEPLYLLLTMLALGLALRLRAAPHALTALLLGLAVAGALLTRSCGVVLLLAVAMTGLRERRREWGLALVPGGLAMLVNALQQHSQHRYMAEFLGNYAGAGTFHTLLGNLLKVPTSWAGAIAGNAPWPGAVLILGLFGLAAIAAAGWRTRQGHLDGPYALLYVTLVVVWPYPVETVRLFMPYLGLAIAQICLAARDIWDCRKTLPWRQLWWLPLIFALGDTAGFVGRLMVPVPPDLTPYRRSTYWQEAELGDALLGIGLLGAADRALAELPKQVPEAACVLAIKPAVVAALGKRISRPPPPIALDKEEFSTALQTGGCDYALLMAMVSPSYPQPLYPASRLPQRLQAIAEYPNAVDPSQPALVLVKILPPTP